jgi:hypothetical protein
MFKELDELDKTLLESISRTPGRNIRKLTEPYYKIKSESAMRQRVRGLALRGLVKFEHGRRDVNVYPVEA